jgi:hypothetical protein
VEWRWLAGGYAIFAGYWTHLTQVIATGVSGPVTTTDVLKVAQFFTERSAIPVVHVTDRLPAVVGRFRSEGFRELGLSHVLVRRVPRQRELATYRTPIVHRLRPTHAREWVRASTQGFLCRDEVSDDELIIGRTLRMAPGQQFHIRAPHGEIAGTAAMSAWSGVAILYGDSTRVSCRHRGVQTNLVRARLAQARLAGCNVAASFVQAGSASEKNYLRCGFEKLYSRITLWRE